MVGCHVAVFAPGGCTSGSVTAEYAPVVAIESSPRVAAADEAPAATTATAAPTERQAVPAWWKDAAPCPEGAYLDVYPSSTNPERYCCETMTHRKVIVRQSEPEVHGRCTSFHPNGVVARDSWSDGGLADGMERWWYEDGSLALVERYRGGNLHGHAIAYHPNGRKAKEGDFVDGVAEKLVFWREDGSLDTLRTEWNEQP